MWSDLDSDTEDDLDFPYGCDGFTAMALMREREQRKAENKQMSQNSIEKVAVSKPIKIKNLTKKQITDRIQHAEIKELLDLANAIGKQNERLVDDINAVTNKFPAKIDYRVSYDTRRSIKNSLEELIFDLIDKMPILKQVGNLMDKFWPYDMPCNKPPAHHYLMRQCILCDTTSSPDDMISYYQNDAMVCSACDATTMTRMGVMSTFGFTKSEADKIKRGGLSNPYSGYSYNLKDVLKAVRKGHGSLYNYAKEKHRNTYNAI